MCQTLALPVHGVPSVVAVGVPAFCGWYLYCAVSSGFLLWTGVAPRIRDKLHRAAILHAGRCAEGIVKKPRRCTCDTMGIPRLWAGSTQDQLPP